MRCRCSAAIAARHLAAPRFPLLLLALLCLAPRSAAQEASPSDNLLIAGTAAATWAEGPSHVIQLEGPVTIDLDRTHMTAAAAVIWLTPIKGAILDEQRAEIALIGEAVLSQQDQISRSGETLFVNAAVRGAIRVTADRRGAENLSTSDVYRRGATLRPIAIAPTTQMADEWLVQTPVLDAPTTKPATLPAVPEPVLFRAANIDTIKTSQDTIALVLTGEVQLFQRRAGGDTLELLADRVVLFTPLHNLREVGKSGRSSRIEDSIIGAYLEGDVRIVNTAGKARTAPQRITGHRVYYDFTNDRAVLTDAIVHTIDPKSNTPLMIRAQVVRQLSEGEYTAEGARLTTSSFATPSYSIGLNKVYIRQIDTGDPRYGVYSEFYGQGATFRLYDTPVFYLPYAAGTVTEKGSILRDLELRSGSHFGTGVVTQWGLFETLGRIPPPETDATYQLDYFGRRGPGIGADGHYAGGFITEQTKEPWSFTGDFEAFGVYDHGTDILSRHRAEVDPPTDYRGRVFWKHQQFLPDDWQVQLTASYISDPTFLEEWFPEEFYGRPAHDTSLYVKHQKDTEALTFLLSYQLNNFVTSADWAQEQFEVTRLPEIGYHRDGESLLGDTFTFFSDNTLSGLAFRRSTASLAEQGYVPGESPGRPSLGTTGTPGNTVYRGDFRQEIDFPFSAGQFRLVPYVMGRYTVYSDSPESQVQNRLYAGAGVRLTTAFWKVDDTVQSDLFDLHRLRHVVEPEINLFAGAQNVSRDRLFQYDESVDTINDITGGQVALHQRWQTKRGEAGRWRSVDVFSLNVEGNFFTHKPKDPLADPQNFRGLFFDSLPETSIPRNSINADATWRVSDETALLADYQYNLDKQEMATGSIGLAVQRDTRLGYFVGTRYIQDLHSNITTLAANYELTPKYSLSFKENFDFSHHRSLSSDIGFIRHLDRLYLAVTLRYDFIAQESGFLVNIFPEGLGKAGAGTAGLNSVFAR